MFRTLSIKNFRGIQELKIDNLNQINIFVGENGTGKTTVLDAIYPTINPNNPGLHFKTNFWRGIDEAFNNQSFWQAFFYNFTEQNTIKISLNNKNKNRSLEILPKYITPLIMPNKGNEDKEEKNEYLKSNIPGEEKLLGLEVKFQIDKKKYKSKIEQGPQGIKITGDKKYQEDLQGNYLNNSTFLDKSSIAIKLSYVLKQKRKEEVLSLLQKFKSSIVDIALDDKRNILIDDKDFSEMVYANIYGDGLMRALHITCTVLADLADIVLIDEIENGLHIKSQSYVWKSVLNFLETQKETQLFATTHSYDIVKYLNEAAKKENKENLVSVFRLTRDKQGKIKFKNYSTDELEYALMEHDEIR